MSQQWTIPLTISVSLGAPAPGAGLASPASLAPGFATEGGRGDGGSPYLDKFDIRFLNHHSFHWRTALSLALASRLAYESKGVVESAATNIWKFSSCEFVESDDTQAFIAAHPSVILVSFRGTENLGDWLSNLNSIGTTRPYGEIHRGFLGAFQVVRARMEELLAKSPKLPVMLTGHSLGGALALIAAAEWRDKFHISRIHTFGQPAVGKKEFRTFIDHVYAGKYHRFVNDDDIVPMVPPWFCHCGSLMHFNRTGELENAIVSQELESLGIELDPLPLDTPMMSEAEFDLLRARLLQDKVTHGGTPLDLQAVAEATLETAGLEGFFPSALDHKMIRYIEKVARKAGV